MFLTHWRDNTHQAGKLLRIAVHWFQQAVGTSVSILADVHTPLPHLESKWIKSLRDFLASIKASLHLDKPGEPELQRQNDIFIMEVIMQSKQFTSAEIRRLNYCRLYLQSITLADLATIAGDKVEDYTLTGVIPTLRRAHQRPWIHQGKPGAEEWKLWRKANRLWSDSEGYLYQSLGKWLLPIHRHRMIHLGYKHRNKVYVRHPSGEFQKCSRVSQEIETWKSTSQTYLWDNLPSGATPIEIQYKGQELWTKVAQSLVISPQHMQSIATFDAFIATLEPWESDILQHTELL